MTVVIPVFNGASVVGAAVGSALAGGPEVEVVVVDDGSTDATLAALEAIDDTRVRVMSTGHVGVSNARNVGARVARAPLLVFLDADDVLVTGWLHAVIVAHRDQQALVACWPVLWRDSEGVRRGGAPTVTRWEIGGFLAGAFSITAALFETVGGYDPLLGYAESTELSMRLLGWLRDQGLELVILEDAWCERAVHPSGAHRHRAYAERRLLASERIVERHGPNLLAGSYLVPRYLAVGGVAASRLARWPEARRLFARSLRGYPSIRGVARLVAASVPGVRDLAWRRHTADHQPDEGASSLLAGVGKVAKMGADREAEWYLELLQWIHLYLRPRTYVEIGVRHGESMQFALPGTKAIGIDPAYEIRFPVPRSTQLFMQTSADFFAEHDLRSLVGDLPVDLSLIDGMHLFENALEDFIFLERNSSSGSVVLAHDCLPLDRESASRTQQPHQKWTGDVWKLIVCLKEYRPDLKICVVDVPPSGLGVITKLDPTSTVLSDRHDEICQRFVPLDYDFVANGMHEKLNRLPNSWNSLLEHLPPQPFRHTNVNWLVRRRRAGLLLRKLKHRLLATSTWGRLRRARSSVRSPDA